MSNYENKRASPPSLSHQKSSKHRPLVGCPTDVIKNSPKLPTAAVTSSSEQLLEKYKLRCNSLEIRCAELESNFIALGKAHAALMAREGKYGGGDEGKASREDAGKSGGNGALVSFSQLSECPVEEEDDTGAGGNSQNSRFQDIEFSQRSTLSDFDVGQFLAVPSSSVRRDSQGPEELTQDGGLIFHSPERKLNSRGGDIRVEKSTKACVRVGVGVLVRDPRHPNKVFAGIRKGSHGAGMLALPGGHLEMYESWSDCAVREVEEETALSILRPSCRMVHITDDPMRLEGKHYLTIFMAAEVTEGRNLEPKNMEPDKCKGWSSYSWKELKNILKKEEEEACDSDVKLFGPLKKLLKDEPKTVVDFFNISPVAKCKLTTV